MKYGITATRDGLTPEQAAVAAPYLLEAAEVHHGDCVGGDTDVHKLAVRIRKQCYRLRIIVHPPADEKARSFCTGADDYHEPLPYLSRNKRIVQETDHLLAFPRSAEEELRSGTWSTVRYARSVKKPYTLVLPDGRTISHKDQGYEATP